MFFPMTAAGEREPQELFLRQVNAKSVDLRQSSVITGSFTVQHGEVTERTRAKIHDRTFQAEQEKTKRQTIMLGSGSEPAPANGKKRKLGPSGINDATIDRVSAIKETARPLPKPSGSAPVSSTSVSRPSAAPARAISSQPGSRPGPKLNKSAAPTSAFRSALGGQNLTSNFRGGLLQKETAAKTKRPVATKDSTTKNRASVKEESSGEHDDVPLAVVTKKKTLHKTGPLAGSSAPSSSASVKREHSVAPLASTSKPRDVSTDLKKPSYTNGSSTSASTSTTLARSTITSKTQPEPAKRKRPVDDGDDDYEGPGAKKRRSLGSKSTSTSTAVKTLNAKKSTASLVKKESISPPTPPAAELPPVVKLARATDEPQLAKGLKFKKQRKTEEVPALLTPPVSMDALAPLAHKPAVSNGTVSAAVNGHVNGHRPSPAMSPSRTRRGTPTFTSTEDETSDDDEAEEGEVRPVKKRKIARPSSSRPPQAIWKPLDALPKNEDALRLRYVETYAEFTSLGKTFASQRYLNMRQLQGDESSVADWEAAETLDEDALLRLKARHGLVCAELTKIQDAFKVLHAARR